MLCLLQNLLKHYHLSITSCLLRNWCLIGRLLEWQENNRIGDHCELNYVSVTAYSLLRSGVTHMGVGREGKVSEWAKLEPGMVVQMFDEGLSERNHGFETV